MPRRRNRRAKRHSSRRRSRWFFRWPRWLTRARLKRWWRAFRGVPSAAQVVLGASAIVALWVPANFAYQAARKPSELLFPVSESLYKTPSQTWTVYGGLFEKHSTAVITPELLAALAQTEASGNPLARTYWRWALTLRPFELYRPASSAVGMFQMTDGTFAEARRYCIHDHRVVEDGPWHDWRSCWFNWLYTRIVPSHAIELTAAHLDRRVHEIVARHAEGYATLDQRQRLAAVVHLCGAGAAARYARRGFSFRPEERCGDHPAAAYVARVAALREVFAAQRARSCGAASCVSPAGTRALTTHSLL